MKVKYFQIVNNHFKWKGERFFRFDPSSEKVLQVCTGKGEGNRGKNQIGIYFIKRTSFLTNYFLSYPDGICFVAEISKKKFDKKFKQTIKTLKYD